MEDLPQLEKRDVKRVWSVKDGQSEINFTRIHSKVTDFDVKKMGLGFRKVIVF